MRQFVKSLLLLFFIVSAIPAIAARQLETFDLYQAEPEQISQIVKQYLSPGSSVKYYQNTLIVNATDAELEKVRALLRSLDKQGQALWIAVKVGNETRGGEGLIQVDPAPVIIDQNGIRTETRTTVTVKQRGFSGESTQRQGVRATEGYAAYISTGVSVPIQQRLRDGQRVVSLHDVNSGFYATAWVNGNTVTIELDQRNDQYQNADRPSSSRPIQNGNFNTQQLQSRVNGELGVWIPVGVVAESKQQSAKDILARGSKSMDSNTTIYLKVELDN